MTESKKFENNSYKSKLFCRGFIYFNRKRDLINTIVSDWNEVSFGNGVIFYHSLANIYIAESGKQKVALVGHAYNPFTMVYNEQELLEDLIKEDSVECIIEKVNQWTGIFSLIFIIDEKIYVLGDCACMQSCYYGVIDETFIVSSHSQLIGDIYNLEQTDYVKKIKKYRFWQKYGLFLPGDISQFEGIKRVIPNLLLCCDGGELSLQRFFPKDNNEMVESEEDYLRVIKNIGEILHNNLELIAKKWHRPAISMTGGMDSKTTLACANGLYDKFSYYSYLSMDGDRIDVDAAKTIANAIGVKHDTYLISENDDDFKSINDLRDVIEHNYGEIGSANSNDVRKRVFFMDTDKFDVEIKSWVSEIGRANYYKKFSLKKLPKHLSARNMTSMYKLFLYNRLTAFRTSKIFKKYIKDSCFNDIFNYDSSDMYLWEFRYGAWGGLVLSSEHRVSYEITIPYNNRLLLNEFLRLPLEKRIKDIPHYDIIKNQNKKIDELGITITNWNETKKRSKLERLYYTINSHLPF